MTILALVLLVYSVLATFATLVTWEAAKRWAAIAGYWRAKHVERMKVEGWHITEGQGMNRSVSERMGLIARWKFRQEINRLCREIEGQA